MIIDSVLHDKQVKSGKEGFGEWKEAAGLMKRNLIQVKTEVDGEMTRAIGPNWVARLVVTKQLSSLCNFLY